jgi:hypothetical protein
VSAIRCANCTAGVTRSARTSVPLEMFVMTNPEAAKNTTTSATAMRAIPRSSGRADICAPPFVRWKRRGERASGLSIRTASIGQVATRIINAMKVAYDVTSKPPG